MNIRCEICKKKLQPTDPIMACAYDCTYCGHCAEVLRLTCANCNGHLYLKSYISLKAISGDQLQQPTRTGTRFHQPVGTPFRQQGAYSSDFYTIKVCKHQEESREFLEADGLTLYLITGGRFDVVNEKRFYNGRSGCVWVQKSATYPSPQREVPEQCTVVAISAGFLNEFIRHYSLQDTWLNDNTTSPNCLINIDADGEYIHYQLKNIQTNKPNRIETDQLILQLLVLVAEKLTCAKLCQKLPEHIKEYHLQNIDRAKVYMSSHFSEDISLCDIAGQSNTSVFHFVRLFKECTSVSPHQYLINIRLKHGEMLLLNSSKNINEISFLCGFKAMSYFSTAFKRKHQASPSKFRAMNSSGINQNQ